MGEQFSSNPPSFVDMMAGLNPLLRDEPQRHAQAKLKQTDVVKAAGDGKLSAMLARNSMKPLTPRLADFVAFLLGDHKDASKVFGCTGALIDSGLALVREDTDRSFTLALALDGKWHGVGVVVLHDETVVAMTAAMVSIGASPKARARDAQIAKAQADRRTLETQEKAKEQERVAQRKAAWAEAHDKDTKERHEGHLGHGSHLGLIARPEHVGE